MCIEERMGLLFSGREREARDRATMTKDARLGLGEGRGAGDLCNEYYTPHGSCRVDKFSILTEHLVRPALSRILSDLYLFSLLVCAFACYIR